METTETTAPDEAEAGRAGMFVAGLVCGGTYIWTLAYPLSEYLPASTLGLLVVLLGPPVGVALALRSSPAGSGERAFAAGIVGALGLAALAFIALFAFLVNLEESVNLDEGSACSLTGDEAALVGFCP